MVSKLRIIWKRTRIPSFAAKAARVAAGEDVEGGKLAAEAGGALKGEERYFIKGFFAVATLLLAGLCIYTQAMQIYRHAYRQQLPTAATAAEE